MTTPHLEAPDYDVVRGFLGCLMASTAATARDLLAGLRPADAGPGIRGVVLELIVGVVAAGAAPDPRVLLAEAQRRGLLETEHAHQQVALWLFETYRAAPFPEAGPYLRGAVLETAVRRRVREHAQRLLDAADRAEVTELQAMTELDDDLVDLWQRLDADLAAQDRDAAAVQHRPGIRRVA